MKKFLWALSAFSLLFSCGKETTEDPKTVGADELNRLTNMAVRSLNSNDGIELNWEMSNNEDDFSGYNIYIQEGTLEDLKTKSGKTLEELKKGGFEREKDSKFFEYFEFLPYGEKAKEETLGNHAVTCKGAVSEVGVLSYKIEDPLTLIGKVLKCEISKKGGENLKPNTNYVLFLSAVEGKKADILSPSSGVVQIKTGFLGTVENLPALPFPNETKDAYIRIKLPLKYEEKLDLKWDAVLATNTKDLLPLAAPTGVGFLKENAEVPGIVMGTFRGRMIVSGLKGTTYQTYLAPTQSRSFANGWKLPLKYSATNTPYKTDFLFEAYEGSVFDFSVVSAGKVLSSGSLVMGAVPSETSLEVKLGVFAKEED